VKSISVKIEQISSVFPSNIGLLAIKLELISSPPGHPLASGVTEASILRAAAEIGAIYVNKKVSRQILLLLIIFQIIFRVPSGRRISNKSQFSSMVKWVTNTIL